MQQSAISARTGLGNNTANEAARGTMSIRQATVTRAGPSFPNVEWNCDPVPLPEEGRDRATPARRAAKDPPQSA